jgi:hypothetical protein
MQLLRLRQLQQQHRRHPMQGMMLQNLMQIRTPPFSFSMVEILSAFMHNCYQLFFFLCSLFNVFDEWVRLSGSLCLKCEVNLVTLYSSFHALAAAAHRSGNRSLPSKRGVSVTKQLFRVAFRDQPVPEDAASKI